MQKTSRSFVVVPILLLSLSILILSLFIESTTAQMAETPKAAATSSPSSSAPKVYIVYTERSQEGVNSKLFHLKTLASVYGSEEGAKGALIYSYKSAASGFSAKLTPQQADRLSKQPGVLQVIPNKTVRIH